MIGRTRPGVSLEQARAELRGQWPAIWKSANPEAQSGPASRAGLAENLRVETLRGGFSTLRARYVQPLHAMIGLSLILVILACVNIGGLMLARAAARERELAVQMALGADRRRLVVQLAGEGLGLALGAGLAALPIAWATSKTVAATLWTAARPLTMQVTPDGPTLMVVAATAVLAGVLVSLPPIIAVALRSHWNLAAGHARAVTTADTRWRRYLLMGQVSVSLVLLFCAALFVRNLQDIRDLDRGYDTAGMRVVRMDPVFDAPRVYDYDSYARELLGRVTSLAEVQDAALSLAFPTTAQAHVTALTPFARDGWTPGEFEVGGTLDRISPGFFRVSGIPLLAGREFTWQDTVTQPLVAVINRPMATRLFAGEDPLGQRIRVQARKQVLTIVGVAADAAPGDPRISDSPLVYIPAAQDPAASGAPMLLMRVRGDHGLLAGLRGVIEPLNRHRLEQVRTIAEQTDRFLVQERALSGVASSFAMLGALVCGLGLYALLTHTYERRRREMGIRLALGASPRSIVSLVLGDCLTVVGIGVLLGVPLALGGSYALRALLSVTSPYDTLALTASIGAVIAIGAVSSLRPAAQAAATDVRSVLMSD